MMHWNKGITGPIFSEDFERLQLFFLMLLGQEISDKYQLYMHTFL